MRRALYWLEQLFIWVVVPGGLLYGLYVLIFGRVSVSDNGSTVVYDFNSVMTRELRAKNPLGVSVSSAFNWDNVDLTYPGRANENDPNDTPVPGVDNLLGDHLVVFKKTQDGLNAAAWLLHDNYFKPGATDTPESLGDTWAGDTQTKAAANGTTSYGDSVAEIMKVGPTSTLTYGVDCPNVMKALARMENGTAYVMGIPDQMYQTAVLYGESA